MIEMTEDADEGTFTSVKPKKRRRGQSGGESDASTSTVTQRPAASPPKTRIPPIVISPSEVTSTWPLFLMQLRDEGIKFDAKFAGDRLHLICETTDDFRRAQKYLALKKVEFHTFAMEADVLVKATLRGLHHSTDVEVIKAELREEGFSPTYVAPMPRRQNGESFPVNSFFVTVQRAGTWAKLWSLTHLMGVRVSMTPFEPRRGLPQCFRCQRYSHSSLNCNLAYRCVKCAGPHDAKQCPKPNEEPPKCCNCNGSHVASWKGCPTHKAAMAAKMRKEAAAANPNTRPSTQRPPARQQTTQAPRPLKPAGTNRGSFADVTGRKQGNPPQNQNVPPNTQTIPPQPQASMAPPPPPPKFRVTEAAQHPEPSRRKQRRKRQPRNKSNRSSLVVAGSEADGDESGMDTEDNPLGPNRAYARPLFPELTAPVPLPQRPAVTRAANTRPPSTSAADPPPSVSADPPPREPASNEPTGVITVQKLIGWMTKAIPALIAAKDKSPAELIADFLQSLLTLLHDG